MFGDTNVPQIITPSVSPVYLNNPSYCEVKIGANMSFSKVQIHSMQLQYYMLFGIDKWTV